MNVNLVFNANTQQVKAQLNELKTSLNSLSSNITLNQSMSSFNKQTNAALGSLTNLRAMLDQATTSSGQLNISKFSLSMQKAGISLASLRKDLSAFGAKGEEAFLQLSRSILDAQQPMKQTNQIIDKLWGSMKNVATWQISSKILYGFMNQISSAYQYTQDLNESLNNIRIVTGYGTDEMSKFAEQANKAAKALSTSTLQYTDAALIYYQQGLSGKEVTQRADATIKLANVARTSGKEASEWMTAIWNNFDNGSKSLEYYADVLTKLGAETASSADEIAGGLEKFSAVANTVGLSYEYAAAALATITAQTRQSEDVVGTSLKTLFARIENLSLGDTLDDGTTLNQYSEALYKVGINVKDASGQLKDMDTILNEMGATWGTLSKDQQVALAQTVGGIRQYNQLIALMDNWDFFEKNVDSARNATGELDKQNEIYAESWEAANKRVQASMEGLYQSILEDDFFIKLTNMTADFVEGLDEVIDSVGGLKTILPSLVFLFTKLFGQKIIVGARDLAYNISLTSRQAQQRNAEFKMSATSNALKEGDASASEYTKAATGALQRQEAITQALSQGTRELTQAELDHINVLKQRLNLQEELFQKNQKKLDNLNNEELPDAESKKNKAKTEYRKFQEKQSRQVSESYQEARKLGSETIQIDARKFQSALRTSDSAENFIKKLETSEGALDGFKTKLKEAYREYQKLMESDEGLALKEDVQSATEVVDNLKNKIKATAEAGTNMEESIKETSDAMVKDIKNINTDYGWGQAFMGLTNGAMSAATAIGILQSTMDTFQSPDATDMEKFTSVLMTLGMGAPLFKGLANTFKALTLIIKKDTEAINKNTTAQLINYLVKNWWIAAIALSVGSIILATKAIANNTKALEKEAEQAQKTAQALRTTAQETREAYNNMLQTSNDYTEGYKGLEKLTQGTQEYKKALLETNAKARELINTYDDLKYTVDEQGAIKIDEDSLIEAQNKEFQKAIAADAAATSAEQRARDLDNEVEIQKALRKNKYDRLDNQDGANAGWGLGAGTGAAAAALLAAAFIPGVNLAVAGTIAIAAPIIGTAVGMAVEDATTAEYNAIEELKNKYSTTEAASTLTADDIQKTLEGKYDQELIDALKADTESIQQLIETNAKNNELTLKENQLMVKEQMQANGTYDNYDSKTADYIAKIGGAGLEQRESALRETMEDWGKAGISQITGVNEKAKEIAKEYLEAIGDTSLKLSDTTGNDNNRQFIFLDEQGKEVKKTLEEMKEAVINHQALKQTAENTVRIAEDVARMRGTNEGQALLEILTDKSLANTASGLVTEELKAAFTSKESTEQFLNSYLEKDGDNKISLETAELYGYETVESMISSIMAIRAASERALNAIDDDMHTAEKTAYDNIIAKQQLSESQLKAFKEEARSAYLSLGEEGSVLFSTLYNSVLPADKDEFMAAVSDIDWAQTSVAEATEKVKDIIDTTSPSWQAYVTEMREAANAALSVEESFNKLRKEINEINKILKDLKYGEVISDEDYQKIIEQNIGLKQFFVETADGWRMIANPQDIKTSVYKEIADDFDNVLAKAKEYDEYRNTVGKKYGNDKDSYDKFTSDIELRYNKNNEEQNAQNTADVQYEALARVGAIKWGGELGENAETLLKRAGVSEEAYKEAIEKILRSDSEASTEDIDIINKIYTAAKDIFTESFTGQYDESNILSSFTDLKDTLIETTEEVLDHKDAVEDTSKAYSNYAAKKTQSLGLSSEEIKLSQREVKSLKAVNKELQNNEEWVAVIAAQNAAMNKGLLDLVNNQEKYTEAFSTKNYADLEEMATSIKNIFDLTAEEDPYDFISTNWDLIQQLMAGNIEVVDDLQKRLAFTRLEALNLTEETAIIMQELLENTDFNMDIFAEMDISDARQKLIELLGDAEKVDEYINAVFGGTFKVDQNKVTKITGSNLINRPAIRNAASKGNKNEPEEFDPKRYHEINEVLDSIGKKLDVISTKKDKAFGADKIKYVKDELKLVSAELDATKTKLDQAKSYLETDKNTILKYGVELDEDGNIKNYNEVRQRYYEQYKTNPEAYEDSWKQLNEDLDQYEQSLDEVTDLEKDHLDQVYKMKELALEEIELTVTFNIEASDDVIKYLDFVMKRLEEDTYDAAESIDLLGQKTQETLDNITTYTEAIKNTLNEAGFTSEEITRFFDGDGSVFEGKTLTEDESKMLRDYRDKIIESSESLREFRKQVFETALNAFNTWNEKLNENADKLERCNKLLETHKNIVDVVGRKYLNIDNEILGAMAEARTNLAQSSVEAAAATYEANKATLESAKQELEKAKLSGDEDSIKEWEEFVKNVEKTTNESEEAMMEALMTAMETAGEVFEETVQRVMETLNEALGNIKELTDKFEKQRKIEELYLADHKKLYEINKLNRDIQNSIDSTDNVKAQRELAKISKEVMAYQAEGAQMSEYDLGYLQKRYELKKAEIALEEAQNAKNQVKLQRDSKGNWGYVYTADQKNIDKAQQDFNKSLYEVQEYSYQSERDLVKQRLQLYEDWQNEISALREEDFASTEEYDAKLAEIHEHYTTRIRAITLEIKDLTAQNAIINQEYSTTMADTYSETLLGQMYPTYSSFEELMNGESQAIENSLTSLSIAYSTWSTNVNTAMTNAKIDAETFATYMSGTFITDINKAATGTTTAAGKIATEMKSKLTDEKSGAIVSVKSFVDQFKTAMGDIYNKDGVADRIAKAMTDISKAATDMADTVISKATAAQNAMNLISNTQGSTSPVYIPPDDGDSQNWNDSEYYDQAFKTGSATYVRQNNKWYKATGSVRTISDNNGNYTSVVASKVDKTKTYDVINATQGSGYVGHIFNGSTPEYYNLKEKEVNTTEEQASKTTFDNAYIEKAFVGTDGYPYAKLYKKSFIHASGKDDLGIYSFKDLKYEKQNNQIVQGSISGDKINQKNINQEFDKNEYYVGQWVAVTAGGYNENKKLVGKSDIVSGTIVDNQRYKPTTTSTSGFRKIKGKDGNYYYVHSNNLSPAAGNEYWNAIQQYDTGGYTGSWGADGRLAMLHQKEIVLNSHDTENFLSAVKIVRSMSDMLEHNAHIAMQGLNLEHNFAQLLNNKQPIEQNVKIEASFPNVTDRYEIEQAFNSLINDASQYANRK